MLEMQVIMSKVLKNNPSNLQLKNFKLDHFDLKPISRGSNTNNRHIRKPSRRYDEPPEDAPLDTARSHDPQQQVPTGGFTDRQSLDSQVTEKQYKANRDGGGGQYGPNDSVTKKTHNKNTPYKREMQLLRLDHGNVSILERESAERNTRHSIIMNSSNFKRGNSIVDSKDNSE